MAKWRLFGRTFKLLNFWTWIGIKVARVELPPVVERSFQIGATQPIQGPHLTSSELGTPTPHSPTDPTTESERETLGWSRSGLINCGKKYLISRWWWWSDPIKWSALIIVGRGTGGTLISRSSAPLITRLPGIRILCGKRENERKNMVVKKRANCWDLSQGAIVL